MKKLLIIATSVLSLSACSWVQLSSEAEKVEVMNNQQASDCQRIGQTTSQVMDKVGFLDRSEEKQTKELETLARNEAASMGGDAIVPATEATDGRQRFIVYRCN